MADRYMYIPRIGLFMIIVWGVDAAIGGMPLARPVAGVAGAAALAACFACTRHQLHYWQDNMSLARHAVEAMPGNYLAYDGYGKALEDAGRKAEAFNNYSKALKLEPRFTQGQYNLGTLLMDLGRPDEAIAHFQAALHESPKY